MGDVALAAGVAGVAEAAEVVGAAGAAGAAGTLGALGTLELLVYLVFRITPGVALTLWGIWAPRHRLSPAMCTLACAAYAAAFFYLSCVYHPHLYVEGSIALCALTVLLAWLLSERGPLESAYVGLSVSGCLQVTQSLVMSVLTMGMAEVDVFLTSVDPVNLALEPAAALLALVPVAAVRRQARLGLADTLRPHHLLALVPPFVLYICFTLWQMPSFDTAYREIPQVQTVALALASLSIVLALVLPLGQLALTRQRVENARLEGLMHERYRGTMRHHEASEGMARVLHDLRNQVACIAETDDEEVRRRHLASIEEEISTWRTVRYTGVATLDVVLNQKRRAARQAGVEFQATPLALPEGFMPSVDVCSVFGNALDNALEACARMPEGSYRYVDVALSRAGSYLAAVVKNPFAGEVRRSADGALLSSKRADAAGYGVASIRRSVERLGGTMQISSEDGEFRLALLLPCDWSALETGAPGTAEIPAEKPAGPAGPEAPAEASEAKQGPIPPS